MKRMWEKSSSVGLGESSDLGCLLETVVALMAGRTGTGRVRSSAGIGEHSIEGTCSYNFATILNENDG